MTSAWGLLGLPFLGFGAGFAQVPNFHVAVPLMVIGALIFFGDAVRCRIKTGRWID